MAKIKKVSISAMDKIIKEKHTSTETVKWNDIDVIIKNTLSFKEMLTFVDSVVKSCFTGDDNTYLPEVRDFAIKSCILEMYANFSMPSNIDHRYDLIYCTNAVETVMEHINSEQLIEMISSIDNKIDYAIQTNISTINKQVNELYATVDNMQDQISSVFSGISDGDMANLIGALANGKFDENKLAKAYINEITNSDGE